MNRNVKKDNKVNGIQQELETESKVHFENKWKYHVVWGNEKKLKDYFLTLCNSFYCLYTYTDFSLSASFIALANTWMTNC
jgi:hypothetical protein